MEKLATELANKVDPERIKNLALDLVRISSSPGQERPVSEIYAGYLRRIGLEAELDEEYLDSPSVIARLRGTDGRLTLQLDGHTNTIPLEGPRPRFEDGYIWGRYWACSCIARRGACFRRPSASQVHMLQQARPVMIERTPGEPA